MAEDKTTTNTSDHDALVACPSYSTAIVIPPPQHLHNHINILRSVYDKSHPRWSPHITIAIPFVSPPELPSAVTTLRTLFEGSDLLQPWTISFSKTDSFAHKESATVYLKPDEQSERRLRAIRERVETVFQLQKSEDGVFRPHLTIGQATLDGSTERLQAKANMLLPISWTFDGLVVINKNEFDQGRMEVFATIPESNTTLVPSASSQVLPERCYSYDESTNQYEVYQPKSLFDFVIPPTVLTISTYNILHSPSQPQTPDSSRLPLLLNILLQQPSTITILQEVTDTSWKYFLSNPSFCQKFPYLSWPSHLPLPNHRNIVILSTIPFQAYYLPLISPHKPALIANFSTFLLAGVHLSSGLHEEKLSLKHKELSKLTTHLQSQTQGFPVILAGDFNIPHKGREYTAALPKLFEVLEQSEDSWPEGEDTFCPLENEFAMEGAKSLASQRYDRILFTRGFARVENRWIFGIPETKEELASDHWGVSVALNIAPNTQTTESISADTKAQVWDLPGVPETRWLDEEILTTLRQANIIPDETYDEGIRSAFSLLQSILEPLKSQIPFLLQPLGSFTLDAHTTSSDLDILAVSTISSKIFWILFLQHLHRFKLSPVGGRIKLLRVIRDAKAPMVELCIDGIKFEVLYCAAGRLIPIWNQVPYLDPDDQRLKFPVLTLKALSSYRDIAILKYLPNISTFQLARRAFKYFCSQKGIYGAKYGYLGGFAVTLLIAGICRILPSTATVGQILAAAIKVYAEFPWEDEILWFPGFEKERKKREERDVMFIASIHRPIHNVTRNASKSTLRVLQQELGLASANLSSTSFHSLCTNALDDFFHNYKSFIKIQGSYWGNQSAQGRAWITWIESRLVILLVNLSKEFKQIETRLWPGRFADNQSDEIHGSYVIGVSGTAIDEGTFMTVLRDVERMMKGEDTTDTPDRWVSVTLVRGKDIISEKLQVDARTFDGEEEITLDEEDIEDTETDDIPTKANSTTSTTSEIKGGKLRPSHDIYNRLLWDAGYNPDEYVVGYEDRFKGVKEMPLTSWKRELSDEEFIPFHRVVYFREKGLDGEIVWDRRTRVDLIFGSGQSKLESGV